MHDVKSDQWAILYSPASGTMMEARFCTKEVAEQALAEFRRTRAYYTARDYMAVGGPTRKVFCATMLIAPITDGASLENNVEEAYMQLAKATEERERAGQRYNEIYFREARLREENAAKAKDTFETVEAGRVEAVPFEPEPRREPEPCQVPGEYCPYNNDEPPCHKTAACPAHSGVQPAGEASTKEPTKTNISADDPCMSGECPRGRWSRTCPGPDTAEERRSYCYGESDDDDLSEFGECPYTGGKCARVRPGEECTNKDCFRHSKA